MATMTQPTPAEASTRELVEVTGGVDTHQDTHTAAVLDGLARAQGHRQFPATTAGYAALLAWLGEHGSVVRVGVEGTGVCGAGLAQFLQQAGIEVVEVDRPDRKTRRRQGKSDRSMPRPPPALPSPGARAGPRRPVAAGLMRCARCGSLAAAPSMPAPIPNAGSGPWW